MPGETTVGPPHAGSNTVRGLSVATSLVTYGFSKRMFTGTRGGSRMKQTNKQTNDGFYHTTSLSAAIFGAQADRSYIVLDLTLWIGLCTTKQKTGV